MHWLLISASLSINTLYINQQSCEMAEERLIAAGHDAICIPVDPDAQIVQIENIFLKFAEMMKGFKDETRR